MRVGSLALEGSTPTVRDRFKPQPGVRTAASSECQRAHPRADRLCSYQRRCGRLLMLAPYESTTTHAAPENTMKGLRRSVLIAAAGGIVLGYAASAPAQVSGSWINPSGGSWSNGANWSCGPLYPDNVGVATFGGDAGSSTSAYTSITPPVGGITLDTLVLEGTRSY